MRFEASRNATSKEGNGGGLSSYFFRTLSASCRPSSCFCVHWHPPSSSRSPSSQHIGTNCHRIQQHSNLKIELSDHFRWLLSEYFFSFFLALSFLDSSSLLFSTFRLWLVFQISSAPTVKYILQLLSVSSQLSRCIEAALAAGSSAASVSASGSI